VKFVSKVDLTSPTSMLYMGNDKSIPVNHSDVYNYDELKKISEYISDPNPVDISRPRVYIYNSHQLENYNNKDLEVYNITPNVIMGAYLLKEKLNNLGIPTIAEDTNMADFMRINAWTHADSYKASRILILDKKSKYDSIEYYIDFHRDSIKRDLTTTTINGKKYARTLFVIGLDNPNYKENLRLANALHEKLNSKYSKLSKGILKKQGAGVDGLYNQDISPKMILLEVGGVENTIEEVLNTIEAFSICFKELIGEYK
jgi:stage II sporulation protein P